MATDKETCVSKGVCLFHTRGKCTQAALIETHISYFDDEMLAKHYEQTGEERFEQIIAHAADDNMDVCQQPNVLKQAALRARARALKFFHPA